MAITLTARFGEPQWGSGADSPSRTQFNAAFLSLDQKAAYDNGEQPTVLPGTEVVDGRYVHVVNGTTRQLYRRGGGAWHQVGGNTWGETTVHRALAGVAQSGVARQVGHADLSAPSVLESWDGTTVRGGRFAVGDVNPAIPSALHVGDTTSVVDLVARGRIYARATAAGHRAVVAAAAGSDAGPLFTAREPGGTDPWTVDALGRMRAQVPAAFGTAGLTTGVPVSVAPGPTDSAGVNLHAAAGKPAARFLRAVDDLDPIGLIEQDRIVLGRATWVGGRIDLIAPTVAVIGVAALQGATLSGTLGVAGATTVAALTATSVESPGQVRGQTVVAVGAFSAEAGKVLTATSGVGATVTARPVAQQSGTAQQSLRAPMVFRRTVSPGTAINFGESAYSTTFTMPEDGWVRLDAGILITADFGESNGIETLKSHWIFELRSSTGTSLLETGVDHASTIATDDTGRQIAGYAEEHFTDFFATRIAAGTYTLRIRYSRTSVLSGTWTRGRFHITPVVLHS